MTTIQDFKVVELLQYKNFQLGDFILFNKEQQAQIGIIEDYNMEQKWFECFIFLIPEQTPAGRMLHHGHSEVFKTSSWDRIDFSNVIKQVYVVKLRDYQKLRVESNLEDVYVNRQDYDQDTQTYLPQLQKCLCNRLLSPEETLIICSQCDRSYCADCPKIKLDSLKAFFCLYCKLQVSNVMINEKFKQSKTKYGTGSQKKMLQKKIVEEEEEDEEIEIKLKTPIIDLETLQKKIKKNEPPLNIPAVQPKSTDKSQNSNNASQIPMDQLYIQKPKQFKNISQDKIDLILEWTEIYKNQESLVQTIPKKRLEVRGKFLQLLLYGIEELRQILIQDPSQLSQQETQIIESNDGALYIFLKKMVLEIEVSLHMKFNNLQRNEQLDQIYIERCKLIYMHMKDDKNFDLRRKVLNKEYTAHDLCIKDERQLSNPEKRQESLERSRLQFDLDKKPKASAIIEEESELLIASKSKTNIVKKPPSQIDTDFYNSIKELLPQASYVRILDRLTTELKPEHSALLIQSMRELHQQK